MTPPIPPGVSRRRTEKACLACRAVKCKCLVQPSSRRCVRCDKLDKECEFGPSFRIGRPRKLPKPDDANLLEEFQHNHGRVPSIPQLSLSGFGEDIYDPRGCSEQPASHPSLTPLRTPQSEAISSCDPLLDLHKLATEYRSIVHPFLPIFPSDPVLLLATFQSAPPLLLYAITCITFPNDTDLPMPEILPTLPNIQAAILLTHAYYGRADTETAQKMLQRASQCLLDLECHLIDAAIPISTSETSTDEELEPLRRVWWECWSLEIIMAAVTGIRTFTLSTNPFYVKPPKDPQVVRIESNQLSPTALRIRALSLLRDCTAPPTDSTPNISRLSSLTTIATNIATLARQLWMKICDQQVLISPLDELACAASREMAFMASLMASAALIYLHTTSYASCVFACGIDVTKSVPPSVSSHVRDASQRIFTLLRDSLSLPLTHSTHSPFFACSQLIAAHGGLLTLDQPNESRTWSRAAVASNLELGEWELRRQALRWPCAQQAVEEIERLRFGLCADIGGKNVRLMLGVD